MEDDTGRYTCKHSNYQDPIYVSVYVTVFQPEQKRCESEWSEGILWNTTLADTTKQELCPAKQKGMAIRYCTQLGVWESPSLINCTTEAFTSASSEMDAIIEDGLENTEKVQEAVNNTLQLMKNLTSSTNELSAGDLSSSLDVLEKIVNVTNSTGSAIEKEVFYAVIDNVLSTNNSKSWTTVSNKTDKDASSILKNMERISEIVIQSGNITASRFSGSNFAINYVAVIYKTISDILPSASDRMNLLECKQDVSLGILPKGDRGSPIVENNVFGWGDSLHIIYSSYFGYLHLDMEGACIAITAIIHYLFLVTFLSMLGMAVYYFISITVTYYAMYPHPDYINNSWSVLGKRLPPRILGFFIFVSHVLLNKKKKGIFERIRNNKVKKSESFLTERTVSTDCPSSVSHEKSSAMPENVSTDHTLKLVAEEENTKRRFRFSFNFNPWKKKYTVTEM
uniref:G-protein coupled receptors family 2 profile 1 domain-containing protein n=1 Tax=Magallana gigas TaxID=29159 RepID=K1RAR9_MAGGI